MFVYCSVAQWLSKDSSVSIFIFAPSVCLAKECDCFFFRDADWSTEGHVLWMLTHMEKEGKTVCMFERLCFKK